MEVLTKQPSAKGPADLFTGDVWFDVIAKGQEPSRMRVSLVTVAAFVALYRTDQMAARGSARSASAGSRRSGL